MNEQAWNPVDLVKTTTAFFKEKGVPNPRVDAELLLVHVLGLDSRVRLYTQFDRPLTKEEVDQYRVLVRRRVEREPVSRILGETEFMGLKMMVAPGVFSPRPETEILVEEAVKLIRPKPRKARSSAGGEHGSERLKRISTATLEKLQEDAEPESDADKAEPTEADDLSVHDPELRDPKRVLDLGTGSGCIAISIVLLCRDAYVAACDVSPAALTIARENAEPHAIWERIDFREGDLFEACWPGESFDMIVSNPPYLVKGDAEIWPEVEKFDPPEALYGGVDGLDYYRRIAADVQDWLKPEGYVLVEVGAGQHEAVLDMFATVGLGKLRTLKDHAGIDRVVVGKKIE